MQRLSGLDAVSIHTETGTMTSHATAILIIEPKTAGPDFDAEHLYGLLVERLPSARAFRLRMLAKPLDLGQPVFVEDPHFEVRRHLHRLAVPAPGGPREVAEVLGEIHRHPLDRNRPLWEAWVLEGLADGQLGVVVKISHAVTDGVGGVTSILPTLLSTDPKVEVAGPSTHPDAAPLPGAATLIGDLVQEVGANALHAVKLTGAIAPGVARGLGTKAWSAVPKLPRKGSAPTAHRAGRDPRLLLPPARTALNAPLTKARSTAFVGVPLADLREVAKAFDVSVNDVYIAACTSALRTWHEQNGGLPEGPLQAFMPINTRRGTADDAPNSWTMALVRLPSFLDDPVERLRAIHTATHRVKTGRGPSGPKVDLAAVVQLIPPTVLTTVANVYISAGLSRLHAPAFHACCSNIPGPKDSLWLGGAQVVGMHSCAPLFEGANLNITAVSHGGRFDIGISACPDNVPEVWDVADAWVAGLTQLRELGA